MPTAFTHTFQALLARASQELADPSPGNFPDQDDYAAARGRLLKQLGECERTSAEVAIHAK